MNRYMQEKFPIIDGSHGMRDEFLDTLTDADLAFSPGGQAMTLGALIREMGEIEYAYLQSLKTRTQDWNYHNAEAGLEGSVARLKAWLQSLDADLKETVTALSDDDLKEPVTRESGYAAPIELQLDFYVQALLIFFGKASIYLRVMGKPLTQAMRDWIW